MIYVKSLDGQTVTTYPYTTSQLRWDNPNVSFPQMGMDAMSPAELALYDAFVVIPTDPPAYDPDTEYLVDGCAFNGSEWIQVWTVEQYPSQLQPLPA